MFDGEQRKHIIVNLDKEESRDRAMEVIREVVTDAPHDLMGIIRNVAIAKGIIAIRYRDEEWLWF